MVACQIPLEEMNRSVLKFLFQMVSLRLILKMFMHLTEGIEESDWEEKKATGFVFWAS